MCAVSLTVVSTVARVGGSYVCLALNLFIQKGELISFTVFSSVARVLKVVGGSSEPLYTKKLSYMSSQ